MDQIGCSTKGVRQYRLLKVTSKGRDGRGKLKRGHYSIGNCINSEMESYVFLEPIVYPENLLSTSGYFDHSSTTLEVNQVIRLVIHWVMKR